MDDVMITRICGQIKKGNFLSTACKASGISQSLFYQWKTKGTEDREAGKRTKAVEFLEAVEHADAVAQQRLLRNVIEKGGWKGSLEVLKRRWPKEWGDKSALMNPDGSALAQGGVQFNLTMKQDPEDNPWKDHTIKQDPDVPEMPDVPCPPAEADETPEPPNPDAPDFRPI